MAVCPSKSIVVEGLSYSRDFFELAKMPAAATSFFDLITSRRAIRNFKEKPVPRELLEKVVAAISFSPPSFPPIKTQIVVVQDTTVIRKALPHMVEVYDYLVGAMSNPVARFFIRRKVGRAKYITIRQHVIPLLRSRLPDLKKGVEDTITRYAPAMIVFHADRDSENYETDINIALTFGMLAAHALGLGATAVDLIGPAIQNNKELRDMFLIPENNDVVASLILGYPKYQYQRGIKRELAGVQWI